MPRVFPTPGPVAVTRPGRCGAIDIINWDVAWRRELAQQFG
ncbi:MAG: hypothetical protein U0075_19600 [Thermomicrobiales bacterium]